jgi:hypothetical protein
MGFQWDLEQSTHRVDCLDNSLCDPLWFPYFEEECWLGLKLDTCLRPSPFSSSTPWSEVGTAH